jgi:hypothetical protein
MTAHEYTHYVRAGLIYDSTFSTQLRNGFEFRGLLQGYISDPPTDGWSTLMEWRNPDYIDRGTPRAKVAPELAQSASAQSLPK